MPFFAEYRPQKPHSASIKPKRHTHPLVTKEKSKMSQYTRSEGECCKSPICVGCGPCRSGEQEHHRRDNPTLPRRTRMSQTTIVLADGHSCDHCATPTHRSVVTTKGAFTFLHIVCQRCADLHVTVLHYQRLIDYLKREYEELDGTTKTNVRA